MGKYIVGSIVFFTLLFSTLEIVKVSSEGAEKAPVSSSIRTVDLTTTGIGTNKEVALERALREAVKGTVTAYLHPSMDSRKFENVRGKILSDYRDYILTHDTLSENRLEDGRSVVTVKSEIHREGILSLFRDARLPTPDILAKELKKITDPQKRLREARDLLEGVVGKPVTDKYLFRLTGYRVDKIGPDSINGHYTLEVAPNPAYWDLYGEILSQL